MCGWEARGHILNIIRPVYKRNKVLVLNGQHLKRLNPELEAREALLTVKVFMGKFLKNAERC